MREQNVELLAPAGNFACFRAAINAGADAVYLGGEQYGARAYADNFPSEEIVEALRIAHLFDRKIYLTVNTLVKESEFGNLIPYITPLYNAGLDGVIVQDIGVLECLHQHFPGLALHASTQMTITGVYGAAYLKKLGVCRVVPARELSLDEIRDIREQTDLEVECFIHGAMCYAYSGQCLFSSVLGGRSGNRGRCAGPCRLPYTDIRNRVQYPLSLKDMYTLPMIPELIQAGIDSFKIEGRMKSPEYVAGVTAIYRKYIDLYLTNPENAYRVAARDEQLIRQLYIRSDTCDGYYQRHNDKSMVTLKEPGYSGSSPEVLKDIQEQYLSQNLLLPITGTAKIYAGKPAELTFASGDLSVTVTGELVSTAQNRPLGREDILQKLCRLGDTCFALTNLTVDTDEVSFMPVKALNELRRAAVSRLEQEILNHNVPERKIITAESCAGNPDRNRDYRKEVNELCVLVTTRRQLLAANQFSDIHKIYVDADIFLREMAVQQSLLPEKEYFLVLPYILRKRSYKYLSAYETLLNNGCFSGVMVRNFEELEWVYRIGYTGKICSDDTVYAWNNASLAFLAGQLDCVTLPLELNKKELNRLSTENDCSVSFVLYGYIPMMFSANCVRKTLEHCIKDAESAEDNKYHLTDRYQNVFTVTQNCVHCYNVLYNTVPLSLHGQLDGILKKNYSQLRLDFTIEDEAQTSAVIDYYAGRVMEGNPFSYKDFPYREFTNGHYKRGVM